MNGQIRQGTNSCKTFVVNLFRSSSLSSEEKAAPSISMRCESVGAVLPKSRVRENKSAAIIPIKSAAVAGGVKKVSIAAILPVVGVKRVSNVISGSVSSGGAKASTGPIRARPSVSAGSTRSATVAKKALAAASKQNTTTTEVSALVLKEKMLWEKCYRKHVKGQSRVGAPGQPLWLRRPWQLQASRTQQQLN
jgi:hypothetical protein